MSGRRKKAQISVVIPNWQGEKVLSENLPSVIRAAQAFPGSSEVIVVDDGSTDGSLDVLGRFDGALRLVRHERNLGFGRAVMSGARAARGEILALLNSDVRVEEGFLDPLVEHFRDPETFGVSPAAENEEGRLLPPHRMIPRFRHGLLRFRKPRFENASRALEVQGGPAPTFFVSGGYCLLRRDRFLELGGFDPLFSPFYYEDTDLGYQAWRRGWKCWFDPRSRVVHAAGGTIGRIFPQEEVKRIRFRNNLLLVWKNTRSPYLLVVHHILPVLARVTHRAARGDGNTWKGFLDALRLFPRVREARARSAVKGGLADREIFRLVGEGTLKPTPAPAPSVEPMVAAGKISALGAR